jgi:signal transduction histidine kinase
MTQRGDPAASAARSTAGAAFRQAFVAALVLLAFAFVGSALYGEMRANEIESRASSIESNSLPSVQHLAAARGALLQLELATDDYARRDHGTAPRDAGAIDRARTEVDREFANELATDMYTGEREQNAVVAKALMDLDGRLTRFYEVSLQDPDRAQIYALADVHEAIHEVDSALDRLLEVNVAGGHAQAIRIGEIRANALRTAFRLELACVGLACVAALFALRAVRQQRRAEAAHADLLQARADELEIFAKRVAHDLLSPLSALSFTLSAVRRNAEKGVSVEAPLARATASLKRSQRLVDSVLEFARSGASPSRSEKTSVRDALDGVLEELHEESEETDVSVVPWTDDAMVRCAPGILTSVLSNLLRNAVKYAGGPGKRVTVRVMPGDHEVRVEVEDAGPGLSSDVEAHVFEPYVRAADSTKPGLGLGLATTRRFVEAHGGHVGVRRSEAGGCLFWFDLPRSPAPRTESRAAMIPIGNGATGR